MSVSPLRVGVVAARTPRSAACGAWRTSLISEKPFGAGLHSNSPIGATPSQSLGQRNRIWPSKLGVVGAASAAGRPEFLTKLNEARQGSQSSRANPRRLTAPRQQERVFVNLSNFPSAL
jgi:hypothetical protein